MIISFTKLHQLLQAQASQPLDITQIKDIKRIFYGLYAPWLASPQEFSKKQQLYKALSAIEPNHYLHAILFNTYDLPVADDQYESRMTCNEPEFDNLFYSDQFIINKFVELNEEY
jgi:hypothetical protein